MDELRGKLYLGDAYKVLQTLPDESVDCCVTSPPYWGLRDYEVEGQIGLEESHIDYITQLVLVFQEVKRVLRPRGTLWVNIADTYASNGGAGNQGKNGARFEKAHTQRRLLRTTDPVHGVKPKDLCGIPWLLALTLRADGWYLRQDIIWDKPNVMPESVKDRCTKSHEYVFLFSKQESYYFDFESIKEQSISTKPAGNKNTMNKGRLKPEGWSFDPEKSIPEKRNRRSVWKVSTKPSRYGHHATYPEELIEPCVLAGCPRGGIILDPFIGTGTTGVVANTNDRKFIGIDLNPRNIEICEDRISEVKLPDLRPEDLL